MAKAKKSVLQAMSDSVTESEVSIDVPSNWTWARLIQIYNFIDYRGKTPIKTEKGIPLVTAKNVRKGYLDYSIAEFISEEEYKERQTRGISHRGDILFTTEAPMGNVAIADLDVFSAGQRVITFQKHAHTNWANNKFYYFYMLSEWFQGELDRQKTGSTVAGIKAEKLMRFPVPVPPLAEQQRIVDRIESLFAKLDEAKEKAQAVVDGAKERKTSLLFQAFTGKLTEQWRAQNVGKYSIDDRLEYENDVVDPSECPTDLPNSWSWIRMGAVGYTNIGLTYRPSDKSDDGIIVLRSSNIQNGKMDYEDIVRVNMSIPENKMCRKGDLLICARNGSKALVGKTAIVDADGMSYGAFMAIFRSIYNPYIYYFLSSPFFRDLIDKDVGTTTINQVTQAIIKNLPLPFAPKEEQNEIVRILSRILDKEDTIIESATRVISQIDTMKKSILARAFRGELGTNDPADESAVELLKRIL